MPHREETLRLVARLAFGRPADRGAAPLGDLFARLARARAEDEAIALEERIWARWMSHPNADIAKQRVKQRSTSRFA